MTKDEATEIYGKEAAAARKAVFYLWILIFVSVFSQRGLKKKTEGKTYVVYNFVYLWLMNYLLMSRSIKENDPLAVNIAVEWLIGFLYLIFVHAWLSVLGDWETRAISGFMTFSATVWLLQMLLED